MREQLEHLIALVSPPRRTILAVRSADNPKSAGHSPSLRSTAPR